MAATVAPTRLRDLSRYWKSQGGVCAGIVGGPRHFQGYHLGRGRIFGPKGKGAQDYSIRLKRDRDALTEEASAIDLGRLGGSLKRLFAFSAWLVKQCQAGAPGTDAIREVIYSPDGKTVLRYDRARGVKSAPRPGEGDRTHLWHTHVSFYRNMLKRNLVAIFAPYFKEASAPAVAPAATAAVSAPAPVPEPAPAPAPVSAPAPVPVPALSFSKLLPGWTVVVRAASGPRVRSAPSLKAPVIRTVPPGVAERWSILGWVTGDVNSGSDQWLVRWHRNQLEFTHRVNVVGEPEDPTPYGKADLERAYAAGKRSAGA